MSKYKTKHFDTGKLNMRELEFLKKKAGGTVHDAWSTSTKKKIHVTQPDRWSTYITDRRYRKFKNKQASRAKMEEMAKKSK